MQERLLAPRILHYTASELVWECAVESKCECKVAVKEANILNYSPFKQNYMRDWSEGGDERDPVYHAQTTALTQLRRLSLRPGSQNIFSNPRPHLKWRSVLAEFTQGNLTFDTDRLAAISGLASAMSEHDTTNSHARDYLFGIWRVELVRNLLWRVTGEGDIFHDGQWRHSRRLDESSAPTWSWASVTGAITYYDEVDDEKQRATQLEPRIDLLDASCNPSTQNLYGRGTGELYVDGDLIPVSVKTSVQGDRSVSRIFDSGSPSDLLGYASLDIRGHHNDEVADEEVLSRLVIAHLVALGWSNIYAQGIRPIGLLLKPILDRANTYRKVGLVKGNLRTAEWSKRYSGHRRKNNGRNLGGVMASLGQVCTI